MKQSHSKYFIYLVLQIFISCGQKEQHSSQPINLLDSKEKIMERVRQLVAEKTECNAQNNQQLHDSCREATQSWNKSDFNWYENGSTVLVMDLQIPTLLTLGRYRHRMRDILGLNSDGKYESGVAESKVLSKGMIEIFEITGREAPYFSSLSLKELSGNIHEVFKSELEYFNMGHGSVAFSVIGEYSPSASFVFAPPPLAPAEILCAKNWAALDIYIEKATATFAEKIRENGVSVINMSGGDDRPNIQKYFKWTCPTGEISRDEENIYLSIVKKFYFGLENLANVFVLQSASPVNNIEDYPIDCAAENPKNRLRINFILDSSNVAIPKNGAAIHSGFDYLFGTNRNVDTECSDVYFNSGSDNKGNYNRESLSVATGFVSQRIQLMYPSWIAPLASAFILSQKNTLFRNMNGEQIAKKMLEPGFPALYDPLGNGQLEAYEKHILGDGN